MIKESLIRFNRIRTSFERWSTHESKEIDLSIWKQEATLCIKDILTSKRMKSTLGGLKNQPNPFPL